jgi:hypothetical protein
VVQAQEPILGDLQASRIIDGQQRLTTLRVLMDATAAADGYTTRCRCPPEVSMRPPVESEI